MDEAGERPSTAGVVGDGGDVSDALSAAGLRPVEGDVETVLTEEPGIVVAVGESALGAIARHDPSVPVLPVGAGRGVRSVPREDIEAVADLLAAGDWRVGTHPLLGLEWSGSERATAFFDAMLVTAKPADISEYSVCAGGEHVARFRADGVVAATPAGSPGYARDAGGPVVTPGLDVLVVVPVAAFATSLDHWVLPPEVTVTVEREEAPVEVLSDDRSVGTVPAGEPVALSVAGRVDIVRVPQGVSPFGRGAAELEKL